MTVSFKAKADNIEISIVDKINFKNIETFLEFISTITVAVAAF